MFCSMAVVAQSGTKVKWDYTAKKIGDKKYELRIVATIQPGWHLYSQTQSADAIVLPTTKTLFFIFSEKSILSFLNIIVSNLFSSL